MSELFCEEYYGRVLCAVVSISLLLLVFNGRLCFVGSFMQGLCSEEAVCCSVLGVGDKNIMVCLFIVAEVEQKLCCSVFYRMLCFDGSFLQNYVVEKLCIEVCMEWGLKTSWSVCLSWRRWTRSCVVLCLARRRLLQSLSRARSRRRWR